MIDLLEEDSLSYIRIERLSKNSIPADFPMKKSEYKIYSDYLLESALLYQTLFVTNTYFLIDNETNDVIAFVSLICDSITFTADEKTENSLADVPFSAFPAIKVAQLAVSSKSEEKYNHVGSFLIDFAANMAFDISNDYVACRFLSMDADIENNPDSPDFYEANGFIRMTDKKYTKKTKIVCMYKNILPAE